jgi:hypothetical protein
MAGVVPARNVETFNIGSARGGWTGGQTADPDPRVTILILILILISFTPAEDRDQD